VASKEKRKMFLVELETGEPLALFVKSHAAMKYGEFIAKQVFGGGLVRRRHEWCTVTIERPAKEKPRGK